MLVSNVEVFMHNNLYILSHYMFVQWASVVFEIINILYSFTVLVPVMLPAPRFNFLNLLLYSYDYKMYVEGLLPAYLCLVTLLCSEQN